MSGQGQGGGRGWGVSLAALVTSALVNSGHAGAGGGRRSDDNDTDKITTGPSYPGTRYTFQKLEQKTSNLY